MSENETQPQEERRLSGSLGIPTKRVVVNDPAQMPNDYSTTPGGTLFSTTPGGTRIIYDRSFLMHCRNSPLAKSPPKLPKIPGITCAGDIEPSKPQTNGTDAGKKPENAEEPQFEMDI